MAKDALQLAVRNHEGRVLNDDREDLENAKPQWIPRSSTTLNQVIRKVHDRLGYPQL